MSGVVFLAAAVGLSIVGSLLLWLRYRKPSSMSHGIESFRREMQALAPQPPAPPGSRPGRRGSRRR